MMLYPGEVGVCSEPMYAWAPPQQVPGTLYLTNLRLVFEPISQYPPVYGIEQALGLSPQQPPPMLNLEVRAITNASAVPAQSGWHMLRVEANGGAFVYQFQTPRAQEWVTSIQGVHGRSAVPWGIPPPPAPPLSSAPVPPALARPPAASAIPGAIWCGRCGKANPPGSHQCANCGARLG